MNYYNTRQIIWGSYFPEPRKAQNLKIKETWGKPFFNISV
jgi:hypothetical protein